MLPAVQEAMERTEKYITRYHASDESVAYSARRTIYSPFILSLSKDTPASTPVILAEGELCITVLPRTDTIA